jgi:hypothetical protein
VPKPGIARQGPLLSPVEGVGGEELPALPDGGFLTLGFRPSGERTVEGMIFLEEIGGLEGGRRGGGEVSHVSSPFFWRSVSFVLHLYYSTAKLCVKRISGKFIIVFGTESPKALFMSRGAR